MMQYFGYEASLEFLYEIENRKARVLEFCEFIKKNYPDLIAIPEMARRENNFGNLFYFSENINYLEKFKREIEEVNSDIKVSIEKIVHFEV